MLLAVLEGKWTCILDIEVVGSRGIFRLLYCCNFRGIICNVEVEFHCINYLAILFDCGISYIYWTQLSLLLTTIFLFTALKILLYSSYSHSLYRVGREVMDED